MNAVEIMRAFHDADDAARVAVIRDFGIFASHTILGREIAALPPVEQSGVLSAIKKDFQADGSKRPKPEPKTKEPAEAPAAHASVEAPAVSELEKPVEVSTPLVEPEWVDIKPASEFAAPVETDETAEGDPDAPPLETPTDN